ncbi:hypothetical protein Q3G72_025186 [Acer saccharum]|nr:hypothetical protein Q3G72_025186 [Acer saccharum]
MEVVVEVIVIVGAGICRPNIFETSKAGDQKLGIRIIIGVFIPAASCSRGNISNGNVCVTGDACIPPYMTPDTGQGGCAALEDVIVLARCIAEEALTGKPSRETDKDSDDDDDEDMEEYRGLK